jgi:hypothetical protein
MPRKQQPTKATTAVRERPAEQPERAHDQQPECHHPHRVRIGNAVACGACGTTWVAGERLADYTPAELAEIDQREATEGSAANRNLSEGW